VRVGAGFGWALAVAIVIASGCGNSVELNPVDGKGSVVDGGRGASDANSTGDVVSGQGSTIIVPACQPNSAPNPGDVLVIENGSTTSTCGTAADPCDLPTAIARKAAVIDLAPGLYAGTFTIASPTKLVGGWTANWSQTCAPSGVKLQPVDLGFGVPADRTLVVTGVEVTATYLDIVSVGTGAVNTSLYGLIALDGATVALDHVNIAIGNGGAGDNGTAGDPGTAPINCPSNPPSSDGQNGAQGGPGTATYGAQGVTLGAGASGTPGHTGTAAPTPATDKILPGRQCQYTGGASGPATMPCAEGPVPCNVNELAGKQGCAGGGGGEGTGGKSGGAAIGIYVWGNSKVSVTNSAIATGMGGVGGNGGVGGAGKGGVQGQSGSVSPDGNCFIDCTQVTCSKSMNGPAVEGTPGQAGTLGGTGGNGGNGGGGAGGDSFAWVADPTSTVALDATGTRQNGGGAGGQPNGAAGKAAEHP
jgi:hypothetical protein